MTFQGADFAISVRRLDDRMSAVDIKGTLTAAVEEPLMQAYHEASGPKTQAILLNFAELEYMNSTGIGLLVTLLVRANRQRQRILACGLSEHYRQIFELTRLDEAIHIAPSEAEALAQVA